MATAQEGLLVQQRPIRAYGGSLRFDYAVVGAAVWFLGGLVIDGWAHSNLDLSAEGFFTPYHAIFYSGFAVVAAVVLIGVWRNRIPGESLWAAVPTGYETTVVGLAIFAVGGALDMAWHIAFGVEQNIQALLSPTHLVFAVGIGAILSGPIRAAAARIQVASWRAQFPALLALALLATLVQFFLMWAFSLENGRQDDPREAYPSLHGALLQHVMSLQTSHGITAVVVRSLILVSLAFFAARRFALPFGAITFIVIVPNVLIGAMERPSLAAVLLQFAAAFVAGMAADAVAARTTLFDRSPWGTGVVGFALPTLFWATYLLLGAGMLGGYWWSIHVVFGAPVIGGLIGFLFAMNVAPRSRAFEVTSRPSDVTRISAA